MKRPQSVNTCIVGLALSLAVGMMCSHSLAQERITSEFKVVSGPRLTHKERQSLSLAAGRILIHVNHARSHIRHKRDKEALLHVQKAIALAKIIETAAPEYRIESSIKAGDLQYRDSETVKSLIIPVYPELDETGSILMPIKRSKKEATSSGDVPAGQGEGQIQFTTISLDVGEAQYYLDEAVTALKRLEFPGADKALASIQEEVDVDLDEMSLPLVKARWHLLDASRKLTRKEFQAAKEALHKAAGGVETYVAQAGEGLSTKARGLADEINHLAIKLDEKKDRALEAIHGFWGRILDCM